MITIVDDHSRETWTYLINVKSHTLSVVTDFLHMVSTQFHSQVQTVRSDNGSEFANTKFQTLLAQNGILHQRSLVYSPQKMGWSNISTNISFKLLFSSMLTFPSCFRIMLSLWPLILLIDCPTLFSIGSPLMNSSSHAPFITQPCGVLSAYVLTLSQCPIKINLIPGLLDVSSWASNLV